MYLGTPTSAGRGVRTRNPPNTVAQPPATRRMHHNLTRALWDDKPGQLKNFAPHLPLLHPSPPDPTHGHLQPCARTRPTHPPPQPHHQTCLPPPPPPTGGNRLPCCCLPPAAPAPPPPPPPPAAPATAAAAAARSLTLLSVARRGPGTSSRTRRLAMPPCCAEEARNSKLRSTRALIWTAQVAFGRVSVSLDESRFEYWPIGGLQGGWGGVAEVWNSKLTPTRALICGERWDRRFAPFGQHIAQMVDKRSTRALICTAQIACWVRFEVSEECWPIGGRKLSDKESRSGRGAPLAFRPKSAIYRGVGRCCGGTEVTVRVPPEH